MVGVWLRSWRRSPLLTEQFAITIAIGMGAATALVSLMLALGYSPLPYRDPAPLVAVWEHAESGAPVLGYQGRTSRILRTQATARSPRWAASRRPNSGYSII